MQHRPRGPRHGYQGHRFCGGAQIYINGSCAAFDPQQDRLKTAALDGKIDRAAPLTNKHGSSNQCWIHGVIETETGTLEIVEAFITKGSGSFSGVGTYLDGSASVVSGTRY